jgi:hypothetical protein
MNRGLEGGRQRRRCRRRTKFDERRSGRPAGFYDSDARNPTKRLFDAAPDVVLPDEPNVPKPQAARNRGMNDPRHEGRAVRLVCVDGVAEVWWEHERGWSDRVSVSFSYYVSMTARS